VRERSGRDFGQGVCARCLEVVVYLQQNKKKELRLKKKRKKKKVEIEKNSAANKLT
jgi:hypothetical protein